MPILGSTSFSSEEITILSTAAATVLGGIYRWVVKPLSYLYKNTVKTFKIIEESAPTLAEIVAQFKPNGGHSLRDTIDKIQSELEMVRGSQRAVLDSSPIAMFEAESNGNCLWVNRAWRDLAGITDSQAYGQGWQTSILEEDRKRVKDEWLESVAQHRDFNSDYSFRNVLTGKISKVKGYGRMVVDKSTKNRTYMGTVSVYESELQ